MIGILLALAFADGLLAIIYSHRQAADQGVAVQNQDIWEEAALFAALGAATALLLIPSGRAFFVAAAIFAAILGLLSLGDLANARDMTGTAIGVLFLVGNLIVSIAAIGTTMATLRRRTTR